jgi:hypothetical protein
VYIILHAPRWPVFAAAACLSAYCPAFATILWAEVFVVARYTVRL